MKKTIKNWNQNIPFLLFKDNNCSLCQQANKTHVYIDNPLKGITTVKTNRNELDKHGISTLPTLNKGNINNFISNYVPAAEAFEDPMYLLNQPYILKVYELLEQSTKLPAFRIKSFKPHEYINKQGYNLKILITDPLGNDEKLRCPVSTKVFIFHDHIAFLIPKLAAKPTLDPNDVSRHLPHTQKEEEEKIKMANVVDVEDVINPSEVKKEPTKVTPVKKDINVEQQEIYVSPVMSPKNPIPQEPLNKPPVKLSPEKIHHKSKDKTVQSNVEKPSNIPVTKEVNKPIIPPLTKKEKIDKLVTLIKSTITNANPTPGKRYKIKDIYIIEFKNENSIIVYEQQANNAEVVILNITKENPQYTPQAIELFNKLNK